MPRRSPSSASPPWWHGPARWWATGPVYLSFDIDSLDPAFAPGTGTPEIGGLTTREAQAILRGLKGLDIVGGDLVEVAPQYDATANTAHAGAQMLFEILSLMVFSPSIGPLGEGKMNASLFARLVAGFPTDRRQVFLETETGEAVSFAALLAGSGRIATLLRTAGVEPGDRVVAQVEKSAEAVFLYLACLQVGAIYVPLNTAYTATELAYFLNDAEPRVVVCDPANLSAIDCAGDGGRRAHVHARRRRAAAA